MKIGIVTQSVREGRVSLDVANWVKGLASNRNGFTYEIIDLKEYDLPMMGVTPTESQGAAIKNWSNKFNEMDGFIFLTAEYNHALTGVFKNALDYLQPEFHNKAVGLVGYGGVGGARAIEQLRTIMAELGAATTKRNVNLLLAHDFENFSKFAPQSHQESTLVEVFDQVELWTKAFKTIR